LSEVCVVLGASHAGAALVASLRRHGWQGSIVLVGDEPRLPYHRPPLSKQYLSGEKGQQDILIRPEAAYEKLNVQLRLGVRAEAIDRARKSVLLANGEAVRYDKLALTLGSRPRRIPLPGSEHDGVYYLRDLGDVDRIRARAAPGRRAVIIGGGYIGLEAAASLRNRGMAVTVLEAAPRVMQRVTTPSVSGFYSRVHTEQGVDVVLDACIERIDALDAGLVVACSGGRAHAADVVIIAVGIVPNVELAHSAGLAVADGITVDELARTSDPDIVAAGDCTHHPSAIYGRDVRLESVQNAHEQASVAAATLCGKSEGYRALPWFWSDQYDLKLQIAGLSHGHDDIVIRGDLAAARSFAAFYFKQDRMLAVDAVNRPQEFMFGKKVIAGGLAVDRARLADDAASLKDLVAN
jgi:3-phenylpropionate/trans-cinnamate dioxygenase ferredoxin reductase component